MCLLLINSFILNFVLAHTGCSESDQKFCHEQSDTSSWSVGDGLTMCADSSFILWEVYSHPWYSSCYFFPIRHKIIILDEADSMTSAAQQALRRTMELYSSTTRFCLACNVSTKIIEAIQSRAAILRYSRLSNDDVLQCLLKVCQAEEVAYTEDGLEAILFTAEGDMRHALNNLQASSYLASSSGGGTVNQNTVFKVCDQPHPKIVADIITFCSKGNTKEAADTMRSLYQSGYSASDIIGTIFKVVKARTDLSEGLKLEFMREIGFTHMRISDGVNSLLQLVGLVARLSQKSQSMAS